MKETETVTVQEHVDTAREFLAASDREFLDGDDLQASEKLWGAASHAIMAVAEQRGLKYGRHRQLREIATQLAQEHGDPLIDKGFNVAETFHRNFYHAFMEEYEIEQGRPEVHEFTERVLELVSAV